MKVHPSKHRLLKILSQSDPFYLYMQYLLKDFCMNILLWRELTDNNIIEVDAEYSKGSLFRSVTLTDAIPETLIVALIVAETKIAEDEEIKEEENLSSQFTKGYKRRIH